MQTIILTDGYIVATMVELRKIKKPQLHITWLLIKDHIASNVYSIVLNLKGYIL